MMFYAQLDENEICVGISELSSEVYLDNMIRIDKFDISIIGKKYNKISREFE